MFGTSWECPQCHDPGANMLHMFWSCPESAHFWQQIFEVITELTQCTDLNKAEGVLLGLFHRSKRAVVTNRFIDQALIIARRAIAMGWKPPTLPTLSHCGAALLKWSKAEEAALRWEESRGLRRVPIAGG
ncbi:hypothetical protein NDU88_004673 [Pleurodeles waltl]|uniref:Reverse transcriptase zinc-binding domain-containing protein n=1 Tax=Pleurodeles waltl TaxID=8319 RepID=A0AAV7PGR1_PLEWA|nr:hypothetical protein NDU88_004673 [Pleurodeles waltl]